MPFYIKYIAWSQHAILYKIYSMESYMPSIFHSCIYCQVACYVFVLYLSFSVLNLIKARIFRLMSKTILCFALRLLTCFQARRKKN